MFQAYLPVIVATFLVVAMLAALGVTAAVAAVLGFPLLRFRDIYFSIGTLAVGVAAYLTVGNLRPGITSLPVDALRAYTFTGPYYLALGVLVATVVVAVWLKQSKVGLGMMAVRDDEEAAGASGVGALTHKMIAFVTSAALASLAGSAFAYFSVSYYPNFPFSVVWTFEAILVAADAYKRAKSTDPKALADAIRATNITDRVVLGGPLKFNAKGQVQGNLSACAQNLNGEPRVVLPESAAQAKPVFPVPDYKKA